MTGFNVKTCCWSGILCLRFLVQAFENVALNKTAWQLYPHNNVMFSADRAIDGRKSNLKLYGGECALSLYGYNTSEWQVDLEDVLFIHHIIVHYATDNHVWDQGNFLTQYFLGFSLYISNTTNKEDGTLCFRDTNYTKATIPNPVNITCPCYGRYVIYYNNRTHEPHPAGYSVKLFFALCEVEVFGCSTHKYYGKNYCLPCPPNCLEGLCDKVEGTCLSCVEGHTGPGCNEDCPPGLYGMNCQKNCSINCKVPTECDKITGACRDGCKSGWKGSQCENKCFNGTFGQDCRGLCGKCFGEEHYHHINWTNLNECDDDFKGPMSVEVTQSEELNDERNNRFIIIGVLLAGSILVITAVVFAMTSKRLKIKVGKVEILGCREEHRPDVFPEMMINHEE